MAYADGVPTLTEWEKKAIKILRRRPMTSTEIIAAVYKGKEVPFNARSIVTVKLGILARKLEHDDDSDLALVKTPRRGPHPVTYTLRERTIDEL